MKLSTLIATAAFGLVATAAPIRVVIFSPIGSVPGSVPAKAEANPFNVVRIGHAAAHANLPPTRIPWGPPIWTNTVDKAPAGHSTTGCGGLRGMGNKWRQILGLPPIQYETRPLVPAAGEVRIMPISSGRIVHSRPAQPMRYKAPFMMRLHRALNHLGTWEGRVVSFVLGCGIGVLIRMFFVFAILLFRSRRRENAERQTGAIFLPVEEVVFVAPPEYNTDEKVPEYVESEVATENAEEKKEGEEVAPSA